MEKINFINQIQKICDRMYNSQIIEKKIIIDENSEIFSKLESVFGKNNVKLG